MKIIYDENIFDYIGSTELWALDHNHFSYVNKKYEKELILVI